MFSTCLCSSKATLVFLVALIVAQLFLGSHAHAQAQPLVSLPAQSSKDEAQFDFVTERSLYVDATRRLDIEVASHQIYKPFAGALNFDFDLTTRWIKISVQAPSDPRLPLVLVVGPYFLSELVLYYERDGQWIQQRSGAKAPDTQAHCLIGAHCFALSPIESGARTYFLRIDTRNGFYVSTQALTEKGLVNKLKTNNIYLGIWIGILSILICFGTLYWLRFKQPLMGLLSLSQLTAIILFFFTNNLIPYISSLNFPDTYLRGFNVLICLRYMLMSWILLVFFRRLRPPNWLRPYVIFLMLFWLVELLMASFGNVKVTFLLLNWIVMFTYPFVIALVIYQCQNVTGAVKKYAVSAFLLIGMIFFSDVILFFNQRQPSPFIFSASEWLPVIFSGALYLITLKHLKVQQDEMLQNMFDINMLTVQSDFEKMQIKDRSMLIDMLSHELKNPLATIRMALGSLNQKISQANNDADALERIDSINQAIDNMTAVINRCAQLDAVDQRILVPQHSEVFVLESIETLPIIKLNVDRFTLVGPRKFLISTDFQIFTSILNNLIDNAVKYSPINSQIEISVQDLGERRMKVVVSNMVLTNHFPDVTRLFSRYYRSPYAHDKPGTGLGLVLIKCLCELLKGSILYRASEDRVFFEIELPT